VQTLAVVGRVLEGFDEDGRPIWHDGMVVEEGRVAYLGPHPEERAGSGAKVVEVGEGVVLPGFTDSHAHLASLGLALRTLDLRGVRSIKELKRRVAERVKELGPGEWVVGRGWDQELFEEGRWPTRWDLDEAAPKNPVLLVRVCGHAAVANTLALSLAGITDFTPDPPGGSIEKVGGKVTGVLKEAAVQSILSAAQKGSADELVREAEKAMLSSGVTCVHAMSVTSEELEALRSLARSGKLKLRVRAYLDPEAPEPKPENWGTLKVVGLKVIADGSFGARTAALREPYSDDPGNAGVLLADRGALSRLLEKAGKAGLQLAVHAIGDKALEEVLAAAKASGARPRVEHASLAPPDLLDELAELGLWVSAQPRFVVSDWWIVSRLGRERARWAYPFRSFLERGIGLSFSSDAPVEPCNPFEGVYAAVTRGSLEGLEIAELTAREALTPAEAIRCYTETAPKLLGERLGRLSVGYPADFAIVDREPLNAPAGELRSVRVIATYVGGEPVYPAWRAHSFGRSRD
jgi:predicted amidohydrolase YtcJ